MTVGKTFLAAILLLFSSLVSKAEEVTLHISHHGGDERTYFRVAREELEKIPKWEPTFNISAPLSRNEALEIARQAAKTLKVDLPPADEFTVTLQKTNPFEKELLERLPRQGCLWYYMVTFGKNLGSLKGKYTFLVTMSGAVASKAEEQ